jgi:hypothetical protein
MVSGLNRSGMTVGTKAMPFMLSMDSRQASVTTFFYAIKRDKKSGMLNPNLCTGRENHVTPFLVLYIM